MTFYKNDHFHHKDQANQPVWSVDGSKDSNNRQLHIAYHDWEHYSSVRKRDDDSTEPAWLVAGTKEATDVDDIQIEIEDEKPAKPQKPLTGKQKKKLRKEKAMERRYGKKDVRQDEDDSMTLKLEQLAI